MPRTVLLYEPAKALIPLKAGFAAAGIELVPLDAGMAGRDRRAVLGCFVCFYESLRHPLRAWRRRRRLNAAGIPVVTWNRDAPHYLNKSAWRLDLLDRLRPFDFYASHSLHDVHRFGERTLYLANAADAAYNLGGAEAEVLARLRRPDNYRWDVCFFGAMDGARAKEMRPRQEFFAALAPQLERRGIRYLFREAEGMSVAEQVALIQASRINLNFGASCDFGVPVASGLPERCYGIPACGGFLLCDRRTHAADDFTPGSDWAEFAGVDDCVAGIERWLADFGAARDLAERCYHRVMAQHTYAHRAAQLRDALASWPRRTIAPDPRRPASQGSEV